MIKMYRKGLIMLVICAILLSNISFYNNSLAQENEFKMTLKAGISYEISNSSLSEDYSIKRDNVVKYDEIVKKADGSINSYDKDRSYSNLSILMGGKTIIKTNGDKDLNIWFPAEWKDKYITIREISETVVYRQTLKAGQTYEISNNSLTNDYTLKRDNTVKYDEVIKRADGSINSYDKDRSYSNLSISKGAKTIIRPSEGRDLDIWFPTEWKDEYIVIKEISEPVIFRQSLKAGQTYEISNKSLTNDYTLKRDNTVKYDEVIKRADGSINSYDKDRSYSNLSIAKGAKTIIKPSEGRDLAIWFPIEWKDEYIIIKEISEPVISRHILTAGETYVFTNKSLTSDYTLKRESTVKMDVSMNRQDGINHSDKKDQTYTNLSILKGGNTIVRPSGERDLDIWFPYEFPISLINQKTGQVIFKGTDTIPVKPVENPVEKPSTPTKDDYLYDMTDPSVSLNLPHENISKITNKETALQTVIDTTQELTKEQKTSTTGIDLVTLFAEEAISQASSMKVEGNNIEINSKTIGPIQTIATQTKTEMDKALLGQGITTGREISTEVKLITESTKDLKITLDKSIINTKADKITVESPNISVKIDTKEIKEDIKNDPLIITITESEALALDEIYEIASLSEIQISANVKKSYTVNFNRAVKENITVSLPKLEGDVKYQAVIKSDGTVVGGKYNPAKNTIDVKIKENGKYTVKENKKDFTDIKNKSQEMQEAIKVLASKGIIDGNTATTFNPDGSISRAEITALIVKTLSKIDKTAEVKFKDIGSNDWYYNIAGSSMKYGIINGYDDNTFRGKEQIKKDQIIAVAARTLKTEMKYKSPKDTMIYLKSYKDNEKIAPWAKADISLATRENLVLKRVDGNFTGNDYMTRGDAAIIIKRLFDKIW